MPTPLPPTVLHVDDDDLERLALGQFLAGQGFAVRADGICLLDADDTLVRCNRAMAELLGRPFAEVIGQPYDALVRAAAGPLDLPTVARLRQTGRREVLQAVIGPRSFQVSVDPVLND